MELFKQKVPLPTDHTCLRNLLTTHSVSHSYTTKSPLHVIVTIPLHARDILLLSCGIVS